MTTGETVRNYFDRLQQKDGWESLLADDIRFTSFTSPAKQASGRDVYLEATRRFFSMIAGVEVRDVMVDGERACALTRYVVQPPGDGAAFHSDVAEIFTVRNGKIASLAIYFDPSPYSG
jgi:ketosteroid isomerase-like protein